jgi:hypothetical protein
MPEDIKKLKPLTTHGYVAITPTVNFKVQGQDADSASAVRKLYRDGNDTDRMQIITDLYGTTDPEIKDIFDQRLGVNEPAEGIIYGQEKIFAGDNPVTVMRERREKLAKKITEMQQQLANFRRSNLNEHSSQDYIDEKHHRKK